MLRDFKLTEEGDFVIENGDLKIITGDEVLIQKIMFRLKTTAGDYLLEPSVGANLEQFIGQVIDDRLLVRIENTVTNELNKIPELFGVKVNAAPNGENSVIVLIEFESIETQKDPPSLLFNIDLKTGEVIRRS